MKFGTIAHNGEIYNLDYMNSDEVKKILEEIEKCKNNKINGDDYINEK